MTKTLGYYNRFKCVADIWKRLSNTPHLHQMPLQKEMDEKRELIKASLHKYKDETFDIYKDKGFFYASRIDEFSNI